VIISLDALEDSQVSAALCIIGAGPAGLEVARCLDGSTVPIVVLEGGDFDYDPQTQRLHRVVCAGKAIRSPNSRFNRHLPPDVRSESRIRQFGGTSNIWSAKWKALSPEDFEAKGWIAHSGWPLRYEELLPYYRQVVEGYGLPPSLLDAEAFRLDGGQGSLDESLGRTIYYKQPHPLTFNGAFRRVLEASGTVTVILNANVTRLVMDTDAARVRYVVANSLTGKEIHVRAETFVLAGGGLENARLLLALKDRAGQTGGDHGLVGRFFMDHPKVIHGRLVPGQPFKLARFLMPKRRKSGIAFAFCLSPALRERSSLPNYRTELLPTRGRTPWGASLTTVRDAWRARRWSRVLSTSAIILLQIPLHVLRLVLLRYLGLASEYHLVHHLEQLPHPQSRVYLSSTDTDAFGEPLVVLDWRLTEQDRAAFQAYLTTLQVEIARHQIGTVVYPSGDVDLDALADAAHHMGTTRMGTSSAEGVVDGDCKVFGIENLYVAGSSTFPTGGNANPMLTILALSRRLSHHLSHHIRDREASATA
jgi:choline dehydrogenase-like flavoprotein